MSTILVVEDEESIRVGVERLLRLEGFTVRGAADGRAGLQAALELTPDLVITDIHMPFMDGFALLEALRKSDHLSHLPIIMLTAAEDRSNMRRAMSGGADDYITKPFKREELLGSIQAQLEKARQRRRSLEQTLRGDAPGAGDSAPGTEPPGSQGSVEQG